MLLDNYYYYAEIFYGINILGKLAHQNKIIRQSEVRLNFQIINRRLNMLGH